MLVHRTQLFYINVGLALNFFIIIILYNYIKNVGLALILTQLYIYINKII